MDHGFVAQATYSRGGLLELTVHVGCLANGLYVGTCMDCDAALWPARFCAHVAMAPRWINAKAFRPGGEEREHA
jgi:hypothetical protein